MKQWTKWIKALNCNKKIHAYLTKKTKADAPKVFYATNQSCPAFPSPSRNKFRQSDQTVFSERLLVWGPGARCITAPGSLRCSLVLNSSHGSHLLFPVQVRGEISSLLKAIKNIHRSTNLSWDSEGKWGAVTGEKEGRQGENLLSYSYYL